jgi:hypothetical protein
MPTYAQVTVAEPDQFDGAKYAARNSVDPDTLPPPFFFKGGKVHYDNTLLVPDPGPVGGTELDAPDNPPTAPVQADFDAVEAGTATQQQMCDVMAWWFKKGAIVGPNG